MLYSLGLSLGELMYRAGAFFFGTNLLIDGAEADSVSSGAATGTTVGTLSVEDSPSGYTYIYEILTEVAS